MKSNLLIYSSNENEERWLIAQKKHSFVSQSVGD